MEFIQNLFAILFSFLPSAALTLTPGYGHATYSFNNNNYDK